MKRMSLLLALYIATGGVMMAQAGGSDLIPPQRRAASVAVAEALAKPTPPEFSATKLKNPFNPQAAVARAETKAVSRPGTDKELLALLAAGLPQANTAVLNGEPFLILGQKRVKVGDTISIPLEGVTYEVEIVNIERINFTLRYKNEEFTRPLKPGKNP